MNRRSFLQLAALAAAGLVVPERRIWQVSPAAPLPLTPFQRRQLDEFRLPNLGRGDIRGFDRDVPPEFVDGDIWYDLDKAQAMMWFRGQAHVLPALHPGDKRAELFCTQPYEPSMLSELHVEALHTDDQRIDINVRFRLPSIIEG